MSKSRRVESHDRFFFELTKTRQFLIVKRKRLFRTGETYQFQQVDKATNSTTKAWLEVRLPKTLTRRDGLHPWDRAHLMAKRLSSELGELPYVEPESHNGQAGLFRDVFREASTQGDNKAAKPVSPTTNFDPMSMIPDPLKEIRAIVTGAEMLPSNSLPGEKNGEGVTVADDSGSDSDSDAGSPPERSKFRVRELRSGRFEFPLIRKISGWGDFPAMHARMLEVELVQLYRVAKLRAKYPYLESEDFPALSEGQCREILLELFQMPMSRALKKLAPMI